MLKKPLPLRDDKLPLVDHKSIAQALLVAKHLSFRQAASVLGVQESAISRRVRSLEDAIGVSLFERHHRGVRVTRAGAAFLSQAGSALDHIEHAIKVATAAGRGESGRLHIGILSSLGVGFLRELIYEFRERHPSVSLQVSEISSQDYLAQVRTGDLDIACVADVAEVPYCDTMKLWSERLFVVLPTAHFLCLRQEIKWGALRDERFIVCQSGIGDMFHAYFAKRAADLGYDFDIQRFKVGHDISIQLVSLGFGLSVTTEAATVNCYPGVEFRPIAGGAAVIHFSGVWSSKNDNPAFRRFLSLARVMSKDFNDRGGNAKMPSSVVPAAGCPAS